MSRTILHFDEDDYIRALADLADHVYDRAWLLARIDGIARLLTAALARKAHFDSAVAILGRLSVILLNSPRAEKWAHLFANALRITWDNGTLLETRAMLSMILAEYFNMLGSPQVAATLSHDVSRFTTDTDLVLDAYTLHLETTLTHPIPDDQTFIDEAIRLAEESNIESLRLALYVVVARRCLQDGVTEDAQRYLLRARDISEGGHVTQYGAFRLALVEGELYRLTGDYPRAEAALVQAEAALQRMELLLSARTHWCIERGALYLAQEQHNQAIEALNEAIRHHPGGLTTPPIAAARMLLARAHLACDRLDDAAREAESARAIWGKMTPPHPLFLGETLSLRAQIAERSSEDGTDADVQQMYCDARTHVSEARPSPARTALLTLIDARILDSVGC